MTYLARKFADIRSPAYQPCSPGLDGDLARPCRIVFAENLDAWLQIRKLKQVELSKQLRVSPSTVSKWVDGVVNPPFEMIDKIALALKIPVSALFKDATDSRSVERVMTIEDAYRLIGQHIKALDK
jgi:transcriptional regulator with XRE-family HTH domain